MEPGIVCCLRQLLVQPDITLRFPILLHKSDDCAVRAWNLSQQLELGWLLDESVVCVHFEMMRVKVNKVCVCCNFSHVFQLTDALDKQVIVGFGCCN